MPNSINHTPNTADTEILQNQRNSENTSWSITDSKKPTNSKKSSSDDSQNSLSSITDLANAKDLLWWEVNYATDDEIMEIINFWKEFLGKIIHHKFVL